MKHWEKDKRHRDPAEATSKFERWILEEGGSSALAKVLGVHQVTVSGWMSRKTTPTLKVAFKILELSKGELTLDDILKGTSK